MANLQYIMHIKSRMVNHWKEYEKKSHGLTKPVCISGFVDNKEEILREIQNCFLNFPKGGSDSPSLRVFDENNGIRVDLAEKVIAHTSDAIPDFDIWIQHTTGLKKYCIALKEITRWNYKLDKILYHTFVKPYIRHFGIPLGGFEFYCFIGNYGFTPFGIHSDQEHSLLINLGPTPKYIWTWTENQYLKTNGSAKPRMNFDRDFLSSSKHKFVLNSGDFCHIPRNEFHILESPSFSVMLGIIPYPASVAAIQYKSSNAALHFNHFGEQIFKKSLENLMSQYTFMDQTSMAEKYQQLLESNGYISSKPIAIQRQLNKDSLFILSEYTIFFKKINDDVQQLTSRMSEISLHNCSVIQELLETFRAKHALNLKEIQKLLARQLDRASVNYTVQALIDSGTIINILHESD